MATTRPLVGRTASTIDIQDVRKALFRSPTQDEERVSDASVNLMYKLQIEHDVEASFRSLQKEVHEQRIKQLRDLQKVIAEDDWRYTPVEKLIGLH